MESNLIESYITSHPRCEVTGLVVPSPYIMPHHIISRGSGGGDDHNNLIRLLPVVHMHLHMLGNHEFTIRYKVYKIKNALIRQNKWNTKYNERFISFPKRDIFETCDINKKKYW